MWPIDSMVRQCSCPDEFAWAWAHKAQKGHGRHERGCETRCLCAMSEAYDQNDQVPIVVPCASGGNHVTLGHMGCARLHGSHGRSHCMAVTLV